jgi:hypothetical protein
MNRDFDESLIALLYSLTTYAKAYRKHFGTKIGNDAVLGPAWKQIAEGVLALLNGPTGVIDPGVFDTQVLRLAQQVGVEL